MIKLDKKLVYLFAALVAGLFAVSACEQAVGIKVNKNIENSDMQQIKSIKYDSLGNIIYEKINEKQVRLGGGYTAIRVSRNAFLIVTENYENMDKQLSGGGGNLGELIGCDCLVDPDNAEGSCTSSCTSRYEGGKMISCTGSCTGNACSSNSCAKYSIMADLSSAKLI